MKSKKRFPTFPQPRRRLRVYKLLRDTDSTGKVKTVSLDLEVEPFHLFRYLDEQMYRLHRKDENGGKVSDFERFDHAVRQIVGKRITWDELVGNEGTRVAG